MNPVQQALKDSDLQKEDIHEIILVSDSTEQVSVSFKGGQGEHLPPLALACPPPLRFCFTCQVVKF